MDVFLGSIMTFGFNFAPNGWQQCNGQTLGIAQNNALFVLLGTTYGGDGIQTFQLPNLQGRLPTSQGNGIGLTPRVIGELGGTEQVTLLISNLPSHTHAAVFSPSGGASSVTIKASSTPSSGAAYATAPSNSNNVLAASPASGPSSAEIWAPSATNPDITIGGVSGGGSSGGTVTNAVTGNNLPTPIMNPFLVLNFSIALQGIFPSRN